MCGRHTDHKRRCPACHREAHRPAQQASLASDRRLRPLPAAVLRRAAGDAPVHLRSSAASLSVLLGSCEPRPLRRGLQRRVAGSAAPQDARHGKLADAFYEFTDPRALGELLVRRPLSANNPTIILRTGISSRYSNR